MALSRPKQKNIRLKVILNSSPAVLSVGLRCQRRGFAFIWLPGLTPCLITPMRKVIPLDVYNNIPYLMQHGKHSQEWDQQTIARNCGIYVSESDMFFCPDRNIPENLAPCETSESDCDNNNKNI